MAKEFKVSCPKCGVVFAVPTELGGELAECSECEFVFEIPKPGEAESYEVTETGTFKAMGAENQGVDSHSTVKLSRTTIGMIPALKNSFEIGTKSIPPKKEP